MLTRSMVVRIMACGFPGWRRSRRVRAQQPIWTMRRKAMQRRKEDSFPMVEVFVCWSGAWMFVVVAVVVVVVGWGAGFRW
jgi:hypothetical protein